MTDAWGNILAVFIAGIVTENLVFERALGVSKAVARSKSYKGIAVFGSLFCFVAVLSGTVAWSVGLKCSEYGWWNGARGLVVLLCIIASYFVIVAIIGKKYLKNVQNTPAAVVFNSATFGTVFYALENYSKFSHMLSYCISCSLGVTFAMMLIHSGKERLMMSRVPKAFQGIPVVMIYIGILGLAFYGLIGHRLPT